VPQKVQDCVVRYGTSQPRLWLIMKSPCENSSTKRSETSGLAVDRSVYRCLFSGHPEVRTCHPVTVRYYDSADRRLARSEGEKFFVKNSEMPRIQQCRI
jgi:hypothetical protein